MMHVLPFHRIGEARVGARGLLRRLRAHCWTWAAVLATILISWGQMASAASFEILKRDPFLSPAEAAVSAVMEASDGLIYGTFKESPQNSSGLIFQMDKQGGNYRVLHSIASRLTGEGLHLEVRSGESTYRVRWVLESIGFGSAQTAVPPGQLRTVGQRSESVRDELKIIEWYQDAPEGLEHGLTLDVRPTQSSTSGPLRVVLKISGDLAVQSHADGQNLAFLNCRGDTVLSYRNLKVWDARGIEFPAALRVSGNRVYVDVIEGAAQYPLVIDPTFIQEAELKASNFGEGDNFGRAVAVSGDTLIVGATGEDSAAAGVDGDQFDDNDISEDSGAAYVFVRGELGWSQQAYLKGPGGAGFDNFGMAVAISGDTVVVGSPGENKTLFGFIYDNVGAAYVFVRNGRTWTQQAVLKPNLQEVKFYYRFGEAVAISGNTIVVGAPQSDGGAAHVFYRNGTTWSEQGLLMASNAENRDGFGSSVAVSGDTIVVGASEEASGATGVNGDQASNGAAYSGAAYVFERRGTSWSQQAYLKASNTGGGAFVDGDRFGASVAIWSNTIVVGAPLESSSATGANGNGLDNSAHNSGAAYVFVRSGNAWSQQAYLKASNTGGDFYPYGDQFGASVAISRDTILVGAPGEDSAARGFNSNQLDNSAPQSGAAYVFVRRGGDWVQQAYLKANALPANGDGDHFGSTVSVSENSMVVGASLEDGLFESYPDSGASYAYLRDFRWLRPGERIADRLEILDDYDGRRSDAVYLADHFHLDMTNAAAGAGYAFAVQSGGGFVPSLALLESLNGNVLGTVAGVDRAATLLFTNASPRSYLAQVSSALPNQSGPYEIALYRTVRPGDVIGEALDDTDLSSTNRTAAVGAGRWYHDDYLLRGASSGERLSIRVDSLAFLPFIEVRLLADESVLHYVESATLQLEVPNSGLAPRDYVIRVSTSQGGLLGAYTLSVRSAVPELSIWSFAPAAGLPGTWVTVRGTNFLDGLNPAVTGVRFGAVRAALTEPADRGTWQEFDAQVPEEAVSGPIVVETEAATAASTNEFVVLAPIGGIRVESGGVSFAVSSASTGVRNVVEAAPSLFPPIQWQAIATNIAAVPGVWRFTNRPPLLPQQFYRVRRE